MTRTRDDVARALRRAIALYPPEMQEALLNDTERNVEAAVWLSEARSVLDVGGGHGVLAPLLTELGAAVTVTDSFDHPYFDSDTGRRVRAALTDVGVRLVPHDATSPEPLPFPDASFDAVVSLDSMEHWHHSPRRLLQEVVRTVRPEGLFVLGTPNAVNLRKRVTVPLGKSNWAKFDDWYFEPVFYGHVREPTVADLRRIAEDLGLADWQILGRNWLGYRRGRLGRLVTSLVDCPLRLRPGLCANIYLIGRLPAR